NDAMSKNDKRYLMKRRRFGWGWTPVKWQAWLFFVMQFAIIFVALTDLPAKPAQPTAGELVRFFVILVLAIGGFILVAIQVSPTPRWRWGKKKSDNPDEDF
ncbi:MAG TPA: hypothetical protein VFQ70_01825, partial [Candidatus Saccharimonadaceae bacterium]|nr:hypothetical protein [Candidatus Saccharimonadaceae bacterium]